MSVKNSETPQITVLDATASGNFLDKRALATLLLGDAPA